MHFDKFLYNTADELSDYVKKNIYSYDSKYFSFVFLCGAERKENDSRASLQNIFKKHRSDIKCLYSEDLYKHYSDDLLSFEELLFEISNNVVIVLESPGSFCELGSFSIVDKSLDKVIVINDREFENSESYVNNGPIKKIRKNNNDNVYYEEFFLNQEINRKVLIASDKLINKLIAIPITFKFKSSDLIIRDKQLTINDLYLLLLIIVDLVKTFVSLNTKQMYGLLLHLYHVDKITISLNSGNCIDSDIDDRKIISLLGLLSEIACAFEFFNRHDGKYHLSYKKLLIDDYDLIGQDSIIFSNYFIKSSKYKKYRGHIIRYLKKNGEQIWNQ